MLHLAMISRVAVKASSFYTWESDPLMFASHWSHWHVVGQSTAMCVVWRRVRALSWPCQCVFSSLEQEPKTGVDHFIKASSFSATGDILPMIAAVALNHFGETMHSSCPTNFLPSYVFLGDSHPIGLSSLPPGLVIPTMETSANPTTLS